MDTKSKKWKKVISFTAFFAGMNLLLVTGSAIWQTCWFQGGVTEVLQGIREKDYQNTSDFRREMESRFERLVTMAVGGELNQVYAYENYYGSAADTVTETVTVKTVAAEGGRRFSLSSGVFQGSATEAVAADESAVGGGEAVEPSKEENVKAAGKLHEQMEADKNILYSVTYEGEVLYDNTEGRSLDGKKGILPEGYNFLFYFDGNKVSIQKDGKEIDLYGDGYYRPGNDWNLPGYYNYTVNEGSQKATVCMAVMKEPLLYSELKSGGSSTSSDLYWIAQNVKQLGSRSRVWVLCIGAAFLCFLVTWIFRKEKREADRWLAGICGKIWLEGKLLLLVCIVIWIYNIVYWGSVGDGVVYGAPIMFWFLYLFILDKRYNKHILETSAAYRIIQFFSKEELSLPFQKRIVRGCLPVLLLEGIVVIGSFAYLIFLWWEGSWDIRGMDIFMAVLWLFVIEWQFTYLRKVKRTAQDMGNLTAQIEAVKNGRFNEEIAQPADTSLAQAARNLEEIGDGLESAVEAKVKSERMKVELISNVSHDIKTPLTAIISYVELLKQEEELPEHVKDYVRILEQKSERLKGMVQDVFEVSKAVAGQLPVDREILDYAKLLQQTLADMEEEIQRSSANMKVRIPQESIPIAADGKKMYRVFQNLIQNALKYALEGSRIYVTLEVKDEYAVAIIQNTSKYEIESDKDYTERFTRGDESRSDGGSGLGLSIARSFTEACGGSFLVKAEADWFTVSVEFALSEDAVNV